MNSTATSNLTVKAYYFPSSEIRRFQVPLFSTFTALREKLLAHLPQERRQSRVTVKYLDDEDEWVTICEVSDEEDWKVVKTSFKQPIVRLRVCLMSPSPLHEPALVPPMARFGGRAHFGGCHHKPVHWGVVCDGCDMRPIRGIRYKCNECPDFDFCETCFASAKELHDPSHSFQKIESRHHHGRRWNNGPCCRSSPRRESPAHEDPLQSVTVLISNQPAEEACQSETSCVSQEPIVIEMPPESAAVPISPPSNSESVSSSVPLPPSPAPVVERANVQSAAAPASESVEPHPTSRIWNMISPLIAGANNDVESEFASELATLEAMGLLDDRERALRLLRRRRGNLQMVVNELLQ